MTSKDPELKRLKIFTEIYNPNKQKNKCIGLQIEIINSLNHETTQPPHHSSPNTTKSPNRLKGKRRYELPNKNPTTNLPNKTKLQKMTGFGFKRAKKVHDHQKDIFTTNESTIQTTLDSLQEFQRNEFFGNKLTTKSKENLHIINLNVNRGKGEHSLLQLCLNL